MSVEQTQSTLTANTPMPPERLLDVKKLKKYFPIRKGFFKSVVGQVRSVDGVTFHLNQGETLGLVGESGCGKTTTSRCLLRAINPTSGEIRYRQADGQLVDVTKLASDELRPLRREMQMIFQDPFASLNPRMNLLDLVGEPLLVNGIANRKERSDRVADLLRLVGLRPEYMRRFPHAFSGGQRQRIVIARALALNPRLVVADEPVSALDVSVQAQVLNLLLDLQEQLKLTYLFVAHDLSVVRHISDRVAVMYVGRIVEMSPTDELFLAPKHPYTAALLSAVPVADPRIRSKMQPLEGDVPSPSNPLAVAIFIPGVPLPLIYVGKKHQTWKKSNLITSWPVIGKPSYHCLASQSQPDPSRNMLFSADQKVHIDGQGTLTESLQTVDSTVPSERIRTLGLCDIQLNGFAGIDFNNPDLNPEDFHHRCRLS